MYDDSFIAINSVGKKWTKKEKKKLKQPILFYSTVKQIKLFISDTNVLKATENHRLKLQIPITRSSTDPIRILIHTDAPENIHLDQVQYAQITVWTTDRREYFTGREEFGLGWSETCFCWFVFNQCYKRWQSASTWTEINKTATKKNLKFSSFLLGTRRVSATVWSGVCGADLNESGLQSKTDGRREEVENRKRWRKKGQKEGK